MRFTIFTFNFESHQKRFAFSVMFSLIGVGWSPVKELRSLLGMYYNPCADYARLGFFTFDLFWFRLIDRRWDLKS